MIAWVSLHTDQQTQESTNVLLYACNVLIQYRYTEATEWNIHTEIQYYYLLYINIVVKKLYLLYHFEIDTAVTTNTGILYSPNL